MRHSLQSPASSLLIGARDLRGGDFAARSDETSSGLPALGCAILVPGEQHQRAWPEEHKGVAMALVRTATRYMVLALPGCCLDSFYGTLELRR